MAQTFTPSDTIFFNGANHKGVFFNGYEHKEAWMEVNGELCCVWRLGGGGLPFKLPRLSLISIGSYIRRGSNYYLKVHIADIDANVEYSVYLKGMADKYSLLINNGYTMCPVIGSTKLYKIGTVLYDDGLIGYDLINANIIGYPIGSELPGFHNFAQLRLISVSDDTFMYTSTDANMSVSTYVITLNANTDDVIGTYSITSRSFVPDKYYDYSISPLTGNNSVSSGFGGYVLTKGTSYTYRRGETASEYHLNAYDLSNPEISIVTQAGNYTILSTASSTGAPTDFTNKFAVYSDDEMRYLRWNVGILDYYQIRGIQAGEYFYAFTVIGNYRIMNRVDKSKFTYIVSAPTLKVSKFETSTGRLVHSSVVSWGSIPTSNVIGNVSTFDGASSFSSSQDQTHVILGNADILISSLGADSNNIYLYVSGLYKHVYSYNYKSDSTVLTLLKTYTTAEQYNTIVAKDYYTDMSISSFFNGGSDYAFTGTTHYYMNSDGEIIGDILGATRSNLETYASPYYGTNFNCIIPWDVQYSTVNGRHFTEGADEYYNE